jgi:hypothetical protein
VRKTSRKSGRPYSPEQVCGAVWYRKMTPKQRAAVIKRETGKKRRTSRKAAARRTSGGPSFYVASGSSRSPKILAGPFGSYYEAQKALRPGAFVYLRRTA